MSARPFLPMPACLALAPGRNPASDGRGVWTCTLPGSDAVAIYAETSSGGVPLFVIVDERYFTQRDVLDMMERLERRLDVIDPITTPKPPLELVAPD